jgi:hypothetical protein
MPDLLVATSDGALLHSRPVTARATLVIGRSPNCHVVVSSERVSRHHAVIFEFAGAWYAVDLDSTAGLAVDEGPVRLHHFTKASPWVRMGPVVLWMDGAFDEGPTRDVGSSRRAMPIERRKEPAVRTRADFVDPPAPPPETDAPALLVAFRRRSDDALRLLDLAGADRLIAGGSHACDIILAGDDAPMRSLFFRVGSKWAAVDLTDVQASESPGHRRLGPGTRLDLGTVDATVLTAEPAISRGELDEEPSGLEGLDVPDLGSIFASPPDADAASAPKKP